MQQQQTITMGKADRSQQFHELLERHRKIVFKVANSYCRHADDRADLAQEIATQLWRAFPGYDGERSFSTWMYRIALNVAISFLRSGQNRERHSVPLEEEHHDAIGDSGVQPEADERVRELYGADIYANAPSFIWINVAVGVAGLFATWVLHRWSRNPRRPRLGQAVDASVTGSSLRKAKGILDEIEQFERM